MQATTGGTVPMHSRPSPAAAAMAAQATVAGAQLLRPQMPAQAAAAQRPPSVMMGTPCGQVGQAASPYGHATSPFISRVSGQTTAVQYSPSHISNSPQSGILPSTAAHIQGATKTVPSAQVPFTQQAGFTVASAQSYSTAASPAPISAATSYASPYLVTSSGQPTYSVMAPAPANAASGGTSVPRVGAATASAPPGMSISMQIQPQASSAQNTFVTSGVQRPPGLTTAVAPGQPKPHAVTVGAPSSTATWPLPYKPQQPSSHLLGSIAAQPAASYPRPIQAASMQPYQLQATGGRWPTQPQPALAQQPQSRVPWPPQFVQQPQPVSVLYR